MRSTIRSSVLVAAVLALTVVAAPGAVAWPTGPSAPAASGLPVEVTDLGPLATKLTPALVEASGPQTVFVELADRSATDLSATGADRAAVRSARRDVEKTARELVNGMAGARLLSVTSNAVSGLIVSADAAQLRELAGRPDVVSVRRIVEHVKSSTNSVQFTNALNAWRHTGRTGKGVRIGIIDDGIDYTHAAFGGPGTKEAYRSIDHTVIDPRYFPTAKVVGGTDLVGDDYDASGTAGSPVPVPDPNPISCGHHGTHGASIIGSLGVNADGTTFTGDYAKLTPEQVEAMRVAPGMAPEATLYTIKVFGCHGLTSALTPKAMDWALDPNGDGDLGDRLDVLNLALSSNYNAVDDPVSLFVRKLAQHDVLSVFSAGNGNDLYDAAASPGSVAPEALTVASSRDGYVLRDVAQVHAPVPGASAGQFSLAFTGWDTLDVRRPVVVLPAENTTGCSGYGAAERALVKDRIVWVEMDDQATLEGRECGSAARANNAQAGGAAGLVLSSTQDHFASRITGNSTLPMFQFTATETRRLRPTAVAGTLEVSLRGVDKASLPTYDPRLPDTASSFTSRGVRGPAVKPDISAPGDTIAAAWAGSGTDRAVFSGTSMSTPHATGITALIRQAHPDWTYEEVKAAAMNTAGHDLRNEAGLRYAPQRVGAGRIDATAALTTNVLAYSQDDPGAVSVTFGVVAASRPTRLTKTVKVVNKGTTPAVFTARYEGITTTPGVRYTVDRNTVRLAPRGTTQVRVTLHIDDVAALRKTMDPTMEAVQGGLARQFVADAAGRLLLTPVRGATVALRLPVAASPKPAAAVTVPPVLRMGDRAQASLRIAGRGLHQGSGAAAYRSLVSVLELHARSPQLPSCGGPIVNGCTVNGTARGGDLRFVGATSTAPAARAKGRPQDAVLGIGLATWGDWANLGSNTVPVVRFDTTGDGRADFESTVVKAPRSDVLLVSTVDLNRSQPTVVDVQPVNGRFGDTDTNIFDTNVVLLPVKLAALGVDPAGPAHQISYEVAVRGFYRAPGDAVVDRVGGLTFDPVRPGTWVLGGTEPALTYLARPGTALTVGRDPAQVPQDLLVLHHHNAVGARAAVVTVEARAPRGS
ncbi:S8 family serine peptidase [Micromonospora sp. NPDC023956]|uniref:S8 family serine peptidase n=1 Tax=Micromonospora sp. NPDC023956 TaxID=3155722 RepID=UPI00340E3E25